MLIVFNSNDKTVTEDLSFENEFFALCAFQELEILLDLPDSIFESLAEEQDN